ncbi:hypothetical protein ACOSQ4_021589 [Xanthoceras sorbifolium]
MKGLQDSDGTWQEGKQAVERIVVDYFEQIVSSSRPSLDDLEAVMGVVGQQLSASSCHLLDRPYSEDKVRIALFDMAPSKAPGLDGFNAGFYQKFWPIVGKRVPPPTGSFKLNVDASLAVHAGVIGLGLVIRDSLERVRAAGSVSVLAIDTGFSPLLVESDALAVINVLRTGSVPCSDLGLIISDIFRFCRCSIVFSCSFIPGIANRVADSLAKAAISSVEDRFWFEVCPFIVELLVQDDSPG